MDLTIFDLATAEQGAAQPGAFLDLIGPHQSVDDLAQAADTIGYEVLTSLSPRYHRHYLGGAPQ